MSGVKVIESKGNNRYFKMWTILTKENYEMFNKGSKNATAMDLDTAKEIARKVFDKLPKNKDKSYVCNFLYADIWRASKPFNTDKMKFANEDHGDSNENTDLYDWVYGIQILEIPKKDKAISV